MKLKDTLDQGFSDLRLAVPAAAVPKSIAIESLQRLAVPFIDATSPTWISETTAYNLRVPAVPALIVFAKTPQHVQHAVSCGVKAGLKVSARCGNHSYASLGLGGENDHLVVDLTALDSVTVDSSHIATVGAGARLGHLALELHKQGGRAIAHGSCPGVGIAGHLLHGGYGWASHNKGLALDAMKGATVVLANGTEVRCSKVENPDLFWALRGAGSNFGIVTSFELYTFEAPPISTPFKVSLAWDDEKEKVAGVTALVEFARTAPTGLNMRLGAFHSGDHSFDGVYYGTADDLSTILAPLLKETGGGTIEAKEGTWLQGLEFYAERESLTLPSPYKEHGNFFATSLTLKELTSESLKGFVNFWHTKAINSQPGGWFFQLDLHGGPTSAISAIPNSASAYAHRDKAFLIQLYHYSDNDKPYPPEGISLMKGFVDATTTPLEHGDWGMYINYVDSELDRATAAKLYYGENLQRLQELKKRYDPTEVFYYPQSISPAQ